MHRLHENIHLRQLVRRLVLVLLSSGGRKRPQCTVGLSLNFARHELFVPVATLAGLDKQTWLLEPWRSSCLRRNQLKQDSGLMSNFLFLRIFVSASTRFFAAMTFVEKASSLKFDLSYNGTEICFGF